MQFGYVILYVQEVETAIAFYEKAFGWQRRFIDDTGTYGELQTDGTTLAFAANPLAASNLPQGFQENTLANPPAGIEVGFVVDDVEQAFAHAVAAGAIAYAAPKVKPWGQTVAYVRDLDGILIELCSQM
jgi:catechol 2,3-dioxygenase-like lactoylglutathione lyase family enzyme